MERELISIEPARRGWRVLGDAERRRTPLTGPQALERATHLACARHASTGQPTAVKVRMQCGDAVLMALHG